MTPSQHYTEAEKWLTLAERFSGHEWITTLDGSLFSHEQALRIAQVHAILATAPR